VDGYCHPNIYLPYLPLQFLQIRSNSNDIHLDAVNNRLAAPSIRFSLSFFFLRDRPAAAFLFIDVFFSFRLRDTLLFARRLLANRQEWILEIAIAWRIFCYLFIRDEFSFRDVQKEVNNSELGRFL